MPLYGFDPVVRRNQSLEEYQTPFSDYVTAKFMNAFNSNPTTMLVDAMRTVDTLPEDPYQIPFKPRIDAESARQIASESGVKMTVPEEGISQDALDLMIERKTNERARAEAINRSPTGMRSVVGVGSEFVAGALDPLFLAASMIPVVAPTRYALALEAAGTNAISRAGVRAATGAIQGAAGMAFIEPVNYGLHQSLQDDYTALDSIMNIGFGGVLGGGLHVIGGAAKDMVLGYRTKEMSRLVKQYKEQETKPTETPEVVTPETIDAAVAKNEAEIAASTTVETPEAVAPEPPAIGYWQGPGGTSDIEPTAEKPSIAERAKELAFNDRRWYPSETAAPVPARTVVAEAEPTQREAALNAAVGQSLEGKVAEVRPIFDPTVDAHAAAEQAHSPENVRVADKEASVKADEVLETAPKSTALADAEHSLTEAEQALIERWNATGRPPEDLSKALEHTDAIGKQADELSAAAKAAVAKGCI